MDIKEIKEFIDYCEKSKLTSFEYIENNFKISFKKYPDGVEMSSSNISFGEEADLNNRNLDLKVHAAEYMSTQENLYGCSSYKTDDQGFDDNIKIVRSPYVGVVSLPEHIKETEEELHINKGDLICVIEAMKIYNDITSPYDGVIVDIMVEDFSIVEFDQPIMKIKVDVNDKALQEDINCKSW